MLQESNMNCMNFIFFNNKIKNMKLKFTFNIVLFINLNFLSTKNCI